MPTKLNPNQVNENTLEDADGNTKVQVEESADENKIRFDTAGTERMIIDSNGRVGIGTSSPSTTFHAYADASNAYVATIDNDAGSSAHGLKVSTDGTGTGTVILDLEAASTTVFKVRGDGRVGIGVATPGSTLSVDDEIAVGEKLLHRGDSNTYLQFPSNDNITFAAGGSEELKIASDAILVKEYIKHDGDENTLIQFADDKIVLKSGGKAMVTLEEKASSPHEIRLNDGSNNIDFLVKGNGSGAGNPGMKFDASTNRLGINGVGTPDKALHVGGSIKMDGTQPTIFFADGNTEKAEIGINSSDNILIENKTMNKHIVFKVNDQGVVREGLRLDGAVPEVVVNQSAESLVDFRVESDNQTHMLFVDGGNEKGGISTGTPHSGLQIDNSIAFAARAITQNHTVTAGDHTIFANATSTNITVTLPPAANIMGRQYIIKRVDTSGNNVTIDPDGSETIEGASTMILDSGRSVVIQSDNNNWWIVAEYISPP